MAPTIIAQFRKKRAVNSVFNKTCDICYRCKCNFKKRPFNVIYRDVVECQGCGNVMIVSTDDIMRFSDGRRI